MSAKSVARLTPEEYLALDRAAEFKSEYVDGDMYAMSGGTFVHATLAGRVVTELNIALAGRNCRVTTSDARVRATPFSFLYPDVSVVCGKPMLEASDVLLNPIVVVEILSDSTERYDRGLKFARYRRIESLREYVLVSQSDPRIEVFRRQEDESWALREHEGLDSTAKLASLEIELPLRRLYQDIEFPEGAGV
ncbi:MAG: Uma2 family endonuclease [Bryobacteraceae bacterium]|nr:Uma2 family endonuclease [Bryobacteraceae bacterium]